MLNFPKHKAPKAVDYAALRDLIDSVGYQAVIEMTCELVSERRDTLRAAGGSAAQADMMQAVVQDICRIVDASDNCLKGV